jgi:hypothetical protein
MSRAIIFFFAALILGLISGCAVDGIADYQRAMGEGCTPSVTGLVCRDR